MMADFLHTHSHLWPQVKADAADNNDHLAILNAALLVRNKKWDVTTTLTQKWNAMRCRPVGLHECRTDAERDAWQVGFEHGARNDFTGGNNPEDLFEGLQPDLHEIAREGWWAGDAMQQMPWTRDQLTRAQFDAWLASRKEAGRVIDIETCELGRWQPTTATPTGPDLICPTKCSRSAPTASCARPQATAGSTRETFRSRRSARCMIALSAIKGCGRPRAPCIRCSRLAACGNGNGKVKAKNHRGTRCGNGSRSTIRRWPARQSAKSGRGSKRAREREQAGDFEPPF